MFVLVLQIDTLCSELTPMVHYKEINVFHIFAALEKSKDLVFNNLLINIQCKTESTPSSIPPKGKYW